MAYSRQRAVSDGTLQRLDVAISYIRRADINVLLDGVQTSNWSWAGNSDAIQFPSPIPNGVEVTIVRTSQNDRVIHEFAKGAKFVNTSVDQDFLQMLYLSQEYTEGGGQTEFFRDLDMHGYKIRNLGDGMLPGDAVNFKQLNEAASGAPEAAQEAREAAAAANAAAVEAGSLRTDLASAVGSTLVGWRVPPISNSQVTRTVSDRLHDYINLRDYCIPGADDCSDGLQAAVYEGRRTGKVVYAPAGEYIFKRNIVIPAWFPGIVGDCVNKTAFFADTAGGWAWQRDGSGDTGRWENFMLRSGKPGFTAIQCREVPRSGFNMVCYGGGSNEISGIHIYGFNGGGLRIEAIWDSNIGQIAMDECGNADIPAFELSNGRDTSNHTVIARLHVERSHEWAMRIEGLNITIGDIHTERTVGSARTHTHEFYGDLQLSSGRFENMPGDPLVRVRLGIAHGSVANLKIVGIVDYSYGARLPSKAYITNLTMTELRILNSNLRHTSWKGCHIGRLTNRYAERPTEFEDCQIADVDNVGGGVTTILRRCIVTGNIITSGGNNTVKAVDCVINSWPNCTVVEITGGEVTNEVITAYAQNALVRGVLFRQPVMLQSNLVKWDSDACQYSDLRLGSGTPGWKFGPNDVARGPVAPQFLIAPAASQFTRVSGERSHRLKSTSGQPDYWVYTDAGVWKPMGIVPA